MCARSRSNFSLIFTKSELNVARRYTWSTRIKDAINWLLCITSCVDFGIRECYFCNFILFSRDMYLWWRNQIFRSGSTREICRFVILSLKFVFLTIRPVPVVDKILIYLTKT